MILIFSLPLDSIFSYGIINRYTFIPNIMDYDSRTKHSVHYLDYIKAVITYCITFSRHIYTS